MDLSKAYDCVPNGLLIAKPAAYDFGKTTLFLITDYLTNCKNRFNFSYYLAILRGIPQITDYLTNRLQPVKIGSTFSSNLEILRYFEKDKYWNHFYLTSS